MIRALLAAALLTAPAVAALAGGPPDRPKGPPPRVMTLQVEREGKSYIQQILTEYIPQQREVQVVVNGRIEKRVETVMVPVVRQQRTALDDKDVQVFNGAGKRLAGADLPKFLKSVPVLVSSDGKPVDPFYLRLVREDTLVVVAPALADRAKVAVPPV